MIANPSHNAMAILHITDLEAAINHWREKSPSPDGVTLAKPLRALAEVYALMVVNKAWGIEEELLSEPAMDAWHVWYDTTPDTPCIAICSTSQGDDECKGCGRSFEEVQLWPGYTPVEKREIWRRITVSGQSWRFNKYAERAREDKTN
jgi:predicted Fe-S protein YdhL (DUF1289 family)